MSVIIHDLLTEMSQIQSLSEDDFIAQSKTYCLEKHGYTQDCLHARFIDDSVVRVTCFKDGKVECMYIRLVPAIRVQHNVTVPKRSETDTLLRAAKVGFSFAFRQDEPLSASLAHNDTIVKITNGLRTIEAVITVDGQHYTLTYNQLVEW